MKILVKLALQGVLVVGCLGALTGCISYRSTGSTNGQPRAVQLTGSHIPVPTPSAQAAAASSAAPVSVYDRSDLDRSGSTDLAGFLQRVPAVQRHR